MNITAMSQLLYDYTSGYPSLVSRLCKIMDERIAGIPGYADKVDVWTKEGFLEAIFFTKNTLFDDMVKKLSDYPELKRVLYNILFVGSRYSYEADNSILNIGIMFGFKRQSEYDRDCESNI